MLPKWLYWGLQPGEVVPRPDMTSLVRQIERGHPRDGNVLASTGQDALCDDILPVFLKALDVFEGTGWFANEFWDGHVLHILTKRGSRLLDIASRLPRTTRLWVSICTPSDDESKEYMKDADLPSEMTSALQSLYDQGFQDLGISFGPSFSGWEEVDIEDWAQEHLPPVRIVQFEGLYHGNSDLRALSEVRIKRLSRKFKQARPRTEVRYKDSPFKIGEVIQLSSQEVGA